MTKSSDLLTFLRISRNCSCKDARDKVYAVLGLLHTDPELPLQVDYSPHITASWVYLQVAGWHIYATESLEILTLIDGTSAMKMPSWVPDWTRASLVSLPAQFDVRNATSIPKSRITSIDGVPLFAQPRLNYPLGCVLRVSG